MSKGTPAKGKAGRSKAHITCRRCGEHSMHASRGICAHCGFGRTSKLRHYNWMKKK